MHSHSVIYDSHGLQNAYLMAFQRSYDSTLLHRRKHVLFRTVANASDLFIYTPEFPLHKHDATIYIQRIFRLLFTLYLCDRVIIKVFRLQRKTLLLLFGFCFPIIIRVFRINGRLYCYSSSTFGRFWSIFVRAISRELFCQAL